MEKSNQKMNHTNEFEMLNYNWSNLYKFSGIASIIIAILLIGDIFVYAIISDLNTPIEIFALFHDNSLAGLLLFDLFGMIAYLFFIPLILSLYMTLRRSGEPIMAIATVLFIVGIAVFFSTNTGFSVLHLSKQYEIANTQEEKDMLLAACKTMITLFDVNAFMVSYVIVSAAWTMIAFIMLRSNVFSRITAYSGIIAGLSAILAEILENTSKAFLLVAISLYFFAIVSLLVWVLLSGKTLYKLGTESTKADR